MTSAVNSAETQVAEVNSTSASVKLALETSTWCDGHERVEGAEMLESHKSSLDRSKPGDVFFRRRLAVRAGVRASAKADGNAPVDEAQQARMTAEIAAEVTAATTRHAAPEATADLTAVSSSTAASATESSMAREGLSPKVAAKRGDGLETTT